MSLRQSRDPWLVTELFPSVFAWSRLEPRSPALFTEFKECPEDGDVKSERGGSGLDWLANTKMLGVCVLLSCHRNIHHFLKD